MSIEKPISYWLVGHKPQINAWHKLMATRLIDWTLSMYLADKWCDVSSCTSKYCFIFLWVQQSREMLSFEQILMYST